jgi:hypothetical protein
MATSAANVRIGAAVVYIDTYVSTGTAVTTPTDVGHHKVPVEIATNVETLKVEGERSTYPIQITATKGSASIKIVMQEITNTNLATYLQGTISGTGVNIGDAAITYKQLKIVQVPASGSTHTWTFWRCVVSGKEPLKIGKGEEQALSVTFEALYDDTVTTTDKLGKLVVG